MSGMFQWVKSHLVIVLCIAAILVLLPAGFVGSSMWNKKIRTDRQTKVESDFKSLDVKVNYVIDPIMPGDPKIEFSGVPNEAVTKWFKEHRDRQSKELGTLLSSAEAINREGHDVLMQGIFPDPPKEELASRIIEFTRLVAGDPAAKIPPIYEELLKAIHAGTPPDPKAVNEAITELRLREVEKYRNEAGGQSNLTPEQVDTVLKRLVEYRLGVYQGRASEISVYASRDIFHTFPEASNARAPVGALAWSKQPTAPDEPADIIDCFQWQWDYWVFRDVLLAVAKANRTGESAFTPVEDAVVKRIERLNVRELPVGTNNRLDKTEGEPAADGKVPVDFRKSVTGRYSSKANQQYDVRQAELVAIVSSAKLPQLLDAISRTNLMTVLGVQLEHVDPHKDLQVGYYYGTEHVVRATITIETVWLRSWTRPLMPDDVQYFMAVVKPEPKEGEAKPDGAAPASEAPTPDDGSGSDDADARANRRDVPQPPR